MTQVNSAQPARSDFSLRSRATVLTLAQRRAQFEAQMRAMALADLEAVAARLRELNTRLDRQEGRRVTQLEIAEGAGIRYRTYQTWLAAERENADGEGYEKLARFYRRKLGDKTVTRSWIVWGQAQPPKEAGETKAPEATILTRADLERIERIEKEQREQRDLLEEILRRLPKPEPAVLPHEPVPPPPEEPPAEEETGESETG